MKRKRQAAGGARILIVLIVALVGVGLLLILKAPNRTTEYAPGYTPATFSRVHIGMPAERVLELLGEPLSRSSDEATESWDYSMATASPDHMNVRRVVIDTRVNTVTLVDRRTRWDYLGQVLARGDADHAYGD